ncbi:MAG: PIN domain-containing protein [Nanoarchaeota archaeon]|nr:PIN domain-containing protein [Nanoarchaeota archaeon]
MTEKMYLLDTCIWRDFYEDRFSKIGRPLGKYATDLFMKILKNKDKILFSEALIWELKKDYEEKDINDMLNLLFLNKTLIRIEINKEEYLEAKKLSQQRNIPFIDCLNVIHARNYKSIMVSQDFHYLKDLSDIIESVKPEQIS